MDERDRMPTLDEARALERRGDGPGAIDAYRRLGRVEDAIRVAAGAGRFLEGARLALQALGPEPSFAGLDGARRGLALRAALLLVEAGEFSPAIEIFLALNEPERAREAHRRSAGVLVPGAELPLAPPAPQEAPPAPPAAAARALEIAGELEGALSLYASLRMYGDSGRVARALGRPEEAGRHYAEGSMPYEAALCFHEAGEVGRCFDQLVRVPPSHGRYRTACVQALRIAAERGQLGSQLVRLLGDFLDSEPEGEQERRAFLEAAALYERHGQGDMAAEIRGRLGGGAGLA